MEPGLTLTDAPSADEKRLIGEGLRRYNEEQAGYSDSRELAVLVSDPETKHVVGGLLGRTSLGLLFVDLFYVPHSLRGQRVGSRVLEMAEEEAKRRGCSAAMLVTISFQAPGFYERHGYRAFGAIESGPPGTRRIFMAKALA